MNLKRNKIESGLERQFLIALITSDQFLARVGNIADPTLVASVHFRQVIQWCLDHYETYNRAPGRDIEGIYYSWANLEDTDKDEASAVFELLSSVSKKYDESSDQNVDYLVEQFRKFIQVQKVKALKDSISEAVQRGRVDEALEKISQFRAMPTSQNPGVNPYTTESVWDRVYSDRTEPLIQFPGAAGEFLNWAMVREGLIGIQAPEKRGKSHWCLEFAIQALRQRRRVAFFSTGDLSQEEVLQRMAIRHESRPLWWNQCKGGENSPIRIPVGVRDEPDATEEDLLQSRIEYEEQEFERPISRQRTWVAMQRFLKTCGVRPDSNYFMLSCHPTNTINVRGIEGILNSWQYEAGFVPDVVIIDYADILAPESNRKEAREQINDTWGELRRLSQERKILLITPTQANAASYKANIQTQGNFSNDKRKNAHVTGMLALNQNDSEKRAKVMRLNWTVLRGAPFNVTQELYVGICPELGRMLCFSEKPSKFRPPRRDNTVGEENEI